MARSDTPPSDEPGVSLGEGGDGLRDVHDDAAEREEVLGREMLGEEVGEVVVRAHEGDADGVFFDNFADVEVAACDVLGALVVLGVVGEVASSLVIAREAERAVCGRVNLIAEGLEVDAVFSGLREAR